MIDRELDELDTAYKAIIITLLFILFMVILSVENGIGYKPEPRIDNNHKIEENLIEHLKQRKALV